MSYRDDLEAARARVEMLEATVEELEASTAAVRVKELEKRNIDLEEQVSACTKSLEDLKATVSTCAVPLHEGLFLAWIAPGLMLLIWLLAFATVVGADETGSWEYMNVAIIAGLLAPTFGWGRSRKPTPGIIIVCIKLAILMGWTAVWWSPYNDVMRQSQVGGPSGGHTSFDFFWYAPILIFAITLFEAIVLHAFFRRIHSESEDARKPTA